MTWQEIYLVEYGVLIDNAEQSEKEFYQNSYDHKHAYFDELQEYRDMSDKTDVINEALEYVKDGKSGTYAIVSVTEMDPDVIEALEISGEGLAELNVEGEKYDAGDVLWSVYKDADNKLNFNFIEGQQIKGDFPTSVKEDLENDEIDR